MKRIGLIASVAVLVVSVLVHIVPARLASSETQGQSIQKVPAQWPGWTVRNLDVADTPEMKRAVREMLNYDCALLREFRKGNETILVYAAYWAPRSFHPRLISQHTPENCWVGTGMTLIASAYGTPVRFRSWEAWPGQYLKFRDREESVNVIYWHIVGGQTSPYARGMSSEQRGFLATLTKQFPREVGEQYFIRISGTADLRAWENEPLFEAILDAFRPAISLKEVN